MAKTKSRTTKKNNRTRVVLDILGAIADTVFKIVLIGAAVLMIYRGTLMAYDYGYRIFTEEPMSVGEGRIITVQITTDDDAMSIGKMLESKGLIRDSKVFFLQERLSENHGKEVPGIYDLSTSMTGEEMIAVMCPLQEEEEEELSPTPTPQAAEEMNISESEDFFDESMDNFEEDGESVSE